MDQLNGGNARSGVRDSKNYNWPISLGLTCALVFALCCAFTPRWQDNDDVLMSMIAHGYVRAVYGSPQLIYSNILWGYLVRGIPSIDGVTGYSIATLACIVAIGSG